MIFSGTSDNSLSLSSGIITVLIPPRIAARSFSLSPPIGVISPLRVISPVIATAALTFLPVRTETKAVHIAAPALGPSFGVDPSGT